MTCLIWSTCNYVDQHFWDTLALYIHRYASYTHARLRLPGIFIAEVGLIYGPARASFGGSRGLFTWEESGTHTRCWVLKYTHSRTRFICSVAFAELVVGGLSRCRSLKPGFAPRMLSLTNDACISLIHYIAFWIDVLLQL